MNELDQYRRSYAQLVLAMAGVHDEPRLLEAFATTAREQFIGPGPWRIFAPPNYVETVTDDPRFLYQDVVVALTKDLPLNNGQPSLHALCLAALHPEPGETVVHVGAGTGFYTAMLAKLVEPSGRVVGIEIEPDLARRAVNNLAEFTQVEMHCRSGSEGAIPACDVIYVNAGATDPLDSWLDALRTGGRLLFPLTPEDSEGAGGMLLVTKASEAKYDARFISAVMFVPCVGARDAETSSRLAAAFARHDSQKVRGLHRGAKAPDDAWCWGRGWWLAAG